MGTYTFSSQAKSNTILIGSSPSAMRTLTNEAGFSATYIAETLLRDVKKFGFEAVAKIIRESNWLELHQYPKTVDEIGRSAGKALGCEQLSCGYRGDATRAVVFTDKAVETWQRSKATGSWSRTGRSYPIAQPNPAKPITENTRHRGGVRAASNTILVGSNRFAMRILENESGLCAPDIARMLAYDIEKFGFEDVEKIISGSDWSELSMLPETADGIGTRAEHIHGCVRMDSTYDGEATRAVVITDKEVEVWHWTLRVGWYRRLSYPITHPNPAKPAVAESEPQPVATPEAKTETTPASQATPPLNGILSSLLPCFVEYTDDDQIRLEGDGWTINIPASSISLAA